MLCGYALYPVRYGCHGHDYHLAGVDPLATPIDRVVEEGMEYTKIFYAEIKDCFSLVRSPAPAGPLESAEGAEDIFWRDSPIPFKSVTGIPNQVNDALLQDRGL